MKTALVYLALVGMPLLGVVLVLREGRALEAPHSVGGAWLLDSAAVDSPYPCYASEPRPRIRVSQSGLWLDVWIGGASALHLRGTLRGNRIAASGAVAALHDCPAGVLRLHALIGGPTDARTLHGELSRDACAACPPLPLVLVRIPDAR